MKYFILYIIALFIVFQSCRKDEISEKQATAFYKILGSDFKDKATDIKQTPDGGYIVTGKLTIEGDGYPDHTDLLAIKTDKYGNYEWAKHFGDSLDDAGNCVQILSNGNYLFFGYYTVKKESISEESDSANTDFYSVILNENGDTILDYNFGSNYMEKGYYAEITDNNDIIIVGKIEDSISLNHRMYALRVDSSFNNIIWENSYFDRTNPENINHIIRLNSNESFLVTNEKNGNNNILSFMTLNKNNDQNYDFKFTSIANKPSIIGNSAVLLPDKSIIVIGEITNENKDIFLMKIKPPYENADTLWTKSVSAYNNPNSNDIGADIILTHDNNIIIVGYTNSAEPEEDEPLSNNDLDNGFDSYIAKLDTGGNVLFDTTYGTLGDQKANAVIQSSDGRFVLVGSTEFAEGNDLIYMMKVNSECVLRFE
ncbi:hypothetical protein ACFLTE_08865 [Bacteroidota bacterium]